jgi:uncharacterized membrane protein
MLTLLLALAAIFAWKALSARLDRAERELATLKARLENIDTAVRPPAVTRRPAITPPAIVSQPVSEGPREDRDLVGAVFGTRPAAIPATPSPSAPVATTREESIETMIGSRWLLYAGIVALIVGASYFIKLAFDNQWINETARVAIGGIAGGALAYAGVRFVRSGYPLYGQIISGGGIAILYLSAYAAFNFYHLISQPLAFGLMCLITIAAAWLADRQRAQSLAVIAVGGAFATPFLLASGRDAATVLFTYDAILVAGTMLLAHRREWPWLNLLSYTAVVLTIAVWASTSYTPDKFLTTEAFLTLFCGMFLLLLYQGRRSVDPVTTQVRGILWSAPVLYYAASLAVLFDHGIAFLVFLILLHVAGVAAARQRRSSQLRLASWLAAGLPLAHWTLNHATATWFVSGLAAVVGLYAITLLAQLDVIFQGNRRLDDTDVGLLHANGLAAYGCAFLLIDAIHPFAAAPTALAFAIWQLGLAGSLGKRDRDAALHFVGLAFALTSIAIAIQFHAPGAVIGWAAEGAAATWLGLRERRAWLRAGGTVLLAASIVAVVSLQFEPPYFGQLMFINRRALAGMFVVSILAGLAALYRRLFPDVDRELHPRDALLVTANALTLLVLTCEISTFWTLREPSLASGELARDARLSRQAMISMTWAIYAAGLIVAGLRRHYAPIRYLGILVFAATILKVFMIDLASLDRIYRVVSVIGLGVLLLTTSYLYQRSRANEPHH